VSIGERQRIARKRWPCDRCMGHIEPGASYVEVKTTPSDELWPGSWNTWRTHGFEYGDCPPDDAEAAI
jgi:hypothetical protein